jgi:hypothetical protein
MRGTLLALLHSSPAGFTTGRRLKPPVLVAAGFGLARADEAASEAVACRADCTEADLAVRCANLEQLIRNEKPDTVESMLFMQKAAVITRRRDRGAIMVKPKK